MECNKTEDWENTCNREDEKIKDPEKVADVFNSFFLSIAENLYLNQEEKDPIYFLKDAFPCKFHGIKTVPTSSSNQKTHLVMMK
jgi:hypothetical protein